MKKNIRKIPDELLTKLETFKTNEIFVGCAVKFKASELTAGRLKNLGVVLTAHGLEVPGSVVPAATNGKFSSRNIQGEIIVRRDLPKETKYHAVEAPNWGDSYRGTHTVDLPHQQYPRDFVRPRELEVLMNCNDSKSGQAWYIIAFRVNEVLDRTSADFNDKLFENLNLLQECVGVCGIEPADVALADYIKSLHVSWELLPPGTREEVIDRLFRGRSPSPEEKKVAGERYDLFVSLKPKRLVFGASGFRRYFGALLEDDLVVFENVKYGNAVYILFDNWEDLSKRSRTDLLSGSYGTDFERVVHGRAWKKQVRTIVATKRAENKDK